MTMRVGRYDAGRSLVIDPFLVYGTYLGGTFDDVSTGVTVEPNSGNIYISGYSGNANGDTDMTVSKISADGRVLIFQTRIGGSANDQAHGIAANGDGFVYVVGQTNSPDFPTLPTGPNPGGTGWTVTKLTAAGDGIAWREIDRVRVMGRDTPVALFEPGLGH